MKLSERIKSALSPESPWPWLAYLVLFFYPWFFRGPNQREIIIAAIAIPIFLVLYFLAYRNLNRSPTPYVGAIAALGFVMLAVMPSGGVFVVYAGSIAGWRCSHRVALRWAFGLGAATALLSLALELRVVQWAPLVFFTIMTSLASLMTATLKAKNEELRRANAETRRLAAQAERERIARDLHDLLGHTLTVISVKADLASKLVKIDPDRAAAEITDIQTTARRALQEVRSAVDDMKRASLAAEIAQARAALAAADVTLTTDPHLPAIPAALEQPLALLIRESVTNVVRHAQASACRISLDRTDDHVRLEVTDDGRGCTAKDGNGLAGMRTRVAALGGVFAVRSDSGTTIEAVLPVGAI